MLRDPSWLRLKAVRCLEVAAMLPADKPAAKQLRIFAAEFADMAHQLELASAAVLIQKLPAEG
jgi:hypothetical protein